MALVSERRKRERVMSVVLVWFGRGELGGNFIGVKKEALRMRMVHKCI